MQSCETSPATESKKHKNSREPSSDSSLSSSDESEPRKSTTTPVPSAIGCTFVKLKELVNRPDLNGIEVRIVSYQEETGRYVCLLSDMQEVNVLPGNIDWLSVRDSESVVLPKPVGSPMTFTPLSQLNADA